MPERPGPPRVIPSWQMEEPWTTPMTQEEQEGLAQTAMLSGAAPTDRAVTQLLAQFAGDLAANLQRAKG